MIKKDSTKIGVISCPMGQANINPFCNCIDILSRISSNLRVIAIYDENIKYKINDKRITCEVIHKPGKKRLSRIYRYLFTQLKIVWHLLHFKNTKVWIFYLGEGLIFPLLAAKLLQKTTILALGGSVEKEVESGNCRLGQIRILVKKINLVLSDGIILYSPILINQWNLNRYAHKIFIAHEHYIDFQMFDATTPINARENIIGYIGRLSPEKGVLNFVKSIPEILREYPNLKFFIGGNGNLLEDIACFLESEKLNDKVVLGGWISHSQLPTYLNMLKLIVLPSYSEGLPNIMLEAMACQTPILATPVGAIPDFIRDGENGFIMDENSPECIAKNVIRVLENPQLETISKNERMFAEKQFSYDATVKKYRDIFIDSKFL